ncbi:hypothetical protein DBT_2005 [Dissulfuribacter thermophilus]|uniref:Uncharacterized protein n=1 Tax=Dissulfuribacter thermophilus TaxID=1156395 RepID=A0A1B9F436_9BACT|nr:hypothetical protein DBT_2005 [Dissulfuribacter thermophilus]
MKTNQNAVKNKVLFIVLTPLPDLFKLILHDTRIICCNHEKFTLYRVTGRRKRGEGRSINC